jgi:hypothetical protein
MSEVTITENETEEQATQFNYPVSKEALMSQGRNTREPQQDS